MSSNSGRFTFVELENGWTVGRFAAIDEPGGFVHLVTTRRGLEPGVVASDKPAVAERLSSAFGVRGMAYCRQVHGGRVVVATEPGPAGDADGLVSDAESLALVGFSADCPIILAADPASGVTGMAHASWRGTAGRIGRTLIQRMCETGAVAERIVACICPSAGPCCYEVGRDVLAAVLDGMGSDADRHFHERNGALHLDLWAANAAELSGAGVAERHIHIAGVCTICRNDLFPSHRAEGPEAGRFLAMIAKR